MTQCLETSRFQAAYVAARASGDRLPNQQRTRDQNRTEWNQAGQPAGATFEQFVNAARRELNLPPAAVRVFHSGQTLSTTAHNSADVTEQRWRT